MVPSLSTFIIYMGIDKPFSGLPAPGVNMWYLPYYDLEESYRQIEKCNFSKAGIYMVLASPRGGNTLTALVGAPFKSKIYWQKHKKRVAEEFLTMIERIVPDIKKHIVYFDAASPWTSYRYTFNYHGAAFG